MPDTKSNREPFPPHNERSPGLGYPICRIVGITSLETGVLLNAGMCPVSGKGASESTLLRGMQDSLQEGDILLGDALFSSYFLIASMIEKGVDIVMEQLGSRKKIADFRRGKKPGQKDHLIHLKKPRIKPDWISFLEYEAAPESLEVRELKAKGKVIITTLMCKKSISLNAPL